MAVGPGRDLDAIAAALRLAGFVAADDEAAELEAHAGGDPDRIESALARRLLGEPLAWITGRVSFCGIELRVDPGVYVPRWQSEPLARRAAARLPARGVAVDLCTGCGALAAVLRSLRPEARVVATEREPVAVACAASNGVEVYAGDLLAPLPRELSGAVDVVVGIVPYVPTGSLALLARDTLSFESADAYDGGPEGIDTLLSVISGAPVLLRDGGALLLELGGDQAELLAGPLRSHGFLGVEVLRDDDGDVRGVEATFRAT